MSGARKNRKKSDRRCVFCGEAPANKTKEHVLPLWLIEATGDPKESVPLGVDEHSGRPRFFPLKHLVLPACKVCNETFGELEAQAASVVKAIFARDILSEDDTRTLLDWLDKVRVGLWLWELTLGPSRLTIVPRFRVGQRIGQKDRLVLVVPLDDDLRGLSFFGTQTLAFLHAPSCFGMAMNNVALLNVSFDYLLAQRLGFPYMEDWRALGPGKPEFGFLKPGTGIINPPMLPGRLQFPGITFGQCLFGSNLENARTRNLYQTAAVGRHISRHEGESVVFVGVNGTVTHFANFPSPIFDSAGRTPHYERVFRGWFPVEVLRIQRDLLRKWPDNDWGGESYKAVAQGNRDKALREIEQHIEFYRRTQAATGGLIF
jgi:hypothetical protein